VDCAIVVGKRIKRLRQNLGLTQEEFAEKIGVSHPYISKWECGKAAISTPFLFEIHMTFHVSLSYFNIEGFRRERTAECKN
jgi:transcriptional regulator with XRE-family HTH domain